MKLKVLIIGCGRDGTTSLTKIVKQIFVNNGLPNIKVLHECDNKEIYSAAVDFVKYKKNENGINILKNWSHHVESGNGYAFILPIFRKLFGKELKIIHLKRNREEHINSLFKSINLKRAKKHWGNYLSFKNSNKYTMRIAAFHFNEMSKQIWINKTLDEKLDWYIKKTNSQITKYSKLFTNYLIINTEEINEKKTMIKLLKFINPKWTKIPEPMHLNKIIPVNYKNFSLDEEIKFIDKWRDFDFHKSQNERFYDLLYFIEKTFNETRNKNFFEKKVFDTIDELKIKNNIRIRKKRLIFIKEILLSFFKIFLHFYGFFKNKLNMVLGKK